MSNKKSSQVTEAENSEDEDNVYINAAKSFRVLKQNVPTVIDSDEESLGYYENVTSLPRKATASANVSNNLSPKKTRSQTQRQNAARICSSKNSNETVQEDSNIDTIVLDDFDITPVSNKEIAIVDDDKDEVMVMGDDSTLSDDDNYEVSIKVRWRSRTVHRVSIGRHESFESVFNYFSKLDGISPKQILIKQGPKIILGKDTPASLNLSVIDILDGGVVNKDWSIQMEDNADKKAEIDEDTCNIKVQMADSKQPLIIALKKNQSFKYLYSECAKQLSMGDEDIKLFFDGEQVDSTDTPNSLDLEQEACFDLRISKSVETNKSKKKTRTG